MKFKGTKETLLLSVNKQLLALDDKIYTIEIKEYKEKRNLNQNAKYYKLLNQLSLKLQTPVEELHFEMLKKASVRYEILVPDDYEIRGIEYFEIIGKKQNKDKLFKIARVYTPSHELKTNEFAILLKSLCEDCKEVGIETLSLSELLELENLINE